MSSDSRAAIVVGCLLSQKKQKHLNFPALQARARQLGLQLVEVSLDAPSFSIATVSVEGVDGTVFDEQRPLAAVVHKLTDQIALAAEGDASAAAQLARIQESSVPMIDPLDSVSKLTNRAETCAIVDGLCKGRLSRLVSKRKLRAPAFACIDEPLPSDALRQKLHQAGVTSCPVIQKPLAAHGSPQAHSMAIFLDYESAAAELTPPCVVQEYINHSGQLHKIFVVGDEYFLEMRPSTRNFSVDERHHVGSIFRFNSHNISKPDSNSDLNTPGALESEPLFELDQEVIKALITSLREELQLSLFGVDVVLCDETGEVVVVDINYFPGYAGVPDFPDVFARFLLHQVGADGSQTQ